MAFEALESKLIEIFKENPVLRIGRRAKRSIWYTYIERRLTFWIAFSGAVALCAVYLIFGCWAQLVCNIIGVLYPAYVSIHAIESSTKQDDTKWLIYWVTFGIFTVIEFFSHIVTNIIPLYWLLKVSRKSLNWSVIIYLNLSYLFSSVASSSGACCPWKTMALLSFTISWCAHISWSIMLVSYTRHLIS